MACTVSIETREKLNGVICATCFIKLGKNTEILLNEVNVITNVKLGGENGFTIMSTLKKRKG